MPSSSHRLTVRETHPQKPSRDALHLDALKFRGDTGDRNGVKPGIVKFQIRPDLLAN